MKGALPPRIVIAGEFRGIGADGSDKYHPFSLVWESIFSGGRAFRRNTMYRMIDKERERLRLEGEYFICGLNPDADLRITIYYGPGREPKTVVATVSRAMRRLLWFDVRATLDREAKQASAAQGSTHNEVPSSNTHTQEHQK